MVAVLVFCDRCDILIHGMEIEGVGTAGFYRVDSGIWHRYANEGEVVLCDKCMRRDYRYIEDYETQIKDKNSER